MEIQDLKGKLNVMKHLEDQDDAAVKKTMKEYTDELEHVETLNQTLIVKERQSNDELQEARKMLIQVCISVPLFVCLTCWCCSAVLYIKGQRELLLHYLGLVP
ncbi:Factor of DNA methylation 1 [Linum perenne]